jgi:hypothetical protein
MSKAIHNLIERLQHRVKQVPDVKPAVASAVIIKLEKQYRCKLPDLVRRIYTEVADGGFGPGYGLFPITSKNDSEQESIAAIYQEVLDIAKCHPLWNWPRKLIPMADMGCGMYYCVDCYFDKLPVILFDQSNLDSEVDDDEAALRWSNAFWFESPSLVKWLNDWLDDVHWKDPVWPSKSWLSIRLWPGQPKYVRKFFEA